MCKYGIPHAIVGYMLNQIPAEVAVLCGRPRSHKGPVEPFVKIFVALDAKGVFDGE